MFNKRLLKNQKGQSLVELMVVMGIMAIILPAILTGFVASREGRAQRLRRLEAVGYLRESVEAVRVLREGGWNNFALNGTFHPEVSGSTWALVSGSESVGSYTRSITISDVQRDSNGAIVDSGGTPDPSTVRVAHLVSWATPLAGQVEATQYLHRYLGNAELVHTTEADFSGGTLQNTRVQPDGDGMVELKPGAGSLTYTDDYNTGSDYTYDSNKVEVVGSNAQLKDTGSADAGSTSNPDFDTNTSGWSFATYQQSVSQSGSRVASGGNPNGYININYPFGNVKNKRAGGYWYQAFTTNSSNPTATLEFDWRVLNYAATPDSFRVYAWIDSGSGTPSQVVFDSGEITSITSWSSTVSVDISSYVTSPGTYYVKVGSYIDYPNAKIGPYDVGFDNVQVTWGGSTAAYASDEPTIYPNSSFTPSVVSSWDGFTEVATLNGGSIMYQVSTDDGTTWQYYQSGGGAPGWAEATGSTDYSDASTLNQRLSELDATSGTIMIKAFLISDGTQQIQLDSISIDYTGEAGVPAGTFVSSSIDAGDTVSFNRILWTENQTANTTVEFQIATNTDDTTWTFVGPDGTASTFFTGGSGLIPLDHSEGRYIRYKIYFSSSSNDLPSVTDVTVNYFP